jgi:hypothetical protein
MAMYICETLARLDTTMIDHGTVQRDEPNEMEKSSLRCEVLGATTKTDKLWEGTLSESTYPG